MSNSISRRAFLKAAGASAAAVGAASLLGGCKQNGDATVVDVKVGDKVSSWNGLGVQLTSLFNIDTAPKTFAIGAQNLAEINAAYPVPPTSNVDANFHALAAASTDFAAVCDGQSVECGVNISLYNQNSQSFLDSTTLPPQGSGYLQLMLLVPKGWQNLQVTYMPTFVEDKTITFNMTAADVTRA